MKAVWKDTILAESTQTVLIEGNHYFPPDSIRKEFFMNSENHTTCPWKGKASYFNLLVAGHTNMDAAWYYPNPKEDALKIKDYVAFWKGVQIVE